VESIATPFIITRLGLLIVGFAALTLFRTVGDKTVPEIGPDGATRTVHLSSPTPALSSDCYWMVNVFSRRDAAWYLDIAKHGYSFSPGEQSNTAFFPLYPALIWAAAKLAGHSDATILAVGIVLSNLSLLVALFYLNALVSLDFDEEVARRTILYVLVFPTTLFLSAFYSESLFLVAIIVAFYYARRANWLGAGLAGAAATLTRPPGVVIFAALALEYFYQRDFRWREVRADVIALVLIPAALIGHFCYFYCRFGDFWLFLRSQQAWGRLNGMPNAIDSFAPAGAEDIFLSLLAVVSIALAWRWLRPSYATYATLAFLVPLASGSLHSMGRFCVVIFPVQMVMAIAGRNSTFDRYWLIVSSGLAVLLMALFSQWH
jgi:Gpi18-like mannosyltransferase